MFPQNRTTIAAAVVAVILPNIAAAGITVHEDGDRYLEFGGRLQLQYHQTDPDAGNATDELEFRRLRIYMEGSVTEDWNGKWQFDLGGTAEEPEVKDAYLQYTGLPVGALTFGNSMTPFSREQNTSSKRQQLVERTFVGDHNFGVPDREMGVNLAGGSSGLKYSVGLYQAGIDRDTSKLDFESSVNADPDYFGNMVIGRLDFYPTGAFKMAQGDFERGAPRYGFGLNGYTWENDEDESGPGSPDYESVQGMGVDAALRAYGFSVDAAFQSFSSETFDAGFTGGIIENGEGDFDTSAIEGGYMFPGSKLELVAGYEALDADAFSETWSRKSVGLNYFFDEHRNKLQFTYRSGDDVDGVDGRDENEIFLQLQHVI